MWRIEIKEYRKRRSNEQNAYIHAVPLKLICDKTGYTVEDMKEFLCGEFTGWDEYTVMGRKKVRPLENWRKWMRQYLPIYAGYWSCRRYQP